MAVALRTARPASTVKLIPETVDLGLFRVEVDGAAIWDKYSEFPEASDIVAEVERRAAVIK